MDKDQRALELLRLYRNDILLFLEEIYPKLTNNDLLPFVAREIDDHKFDRTMAIKQLVKTLIERVG